jgi:hypothetical protein
VLALSALAFAAPGALFLLAPERGGALVGIELAGATARSDARAVFGGLQLACAACSPPARSGRSARLASRSSRELRRPAGARLLGLALDGAPARSGSPFTGGARPRGGRSPRSAWLARRPR